MCENRFPVHKDVLIDGIDTAKTNTFGEKQGLRVAGVALARHGLPPPVNPEPVARRLPGVDRELPAERWEQHGVDLAPDEEEPAARSTFVADLKKKSVSPVEQRGEGYRSHDPIMGHVTTDAWVGSELIHQGPISAFDKIEHQESFHAWKRDFLPSAES